MQPSIATSISKRRILAAFSPFKLRLMLIEGAIRFVNQTLHFWDEERHEEAVESLIRVPRDTGRIDVVALARDAAGEADLAALRLRVSHVDRSAGSTRNHQKMNDALRILGEERETWQLVCEQFASELGESQSRGSDRDRGTSHAPLNDAPRAVSLPPQSFDSDRPAVASFPKGNFPAPISPAPNSPRSFSFEA